MRWTGGSKHAGDGYLAEVVEKTIPRTYIRKDLWGADILAAKPSYDRSCRQLTARALGIEGARPVVQLDAVPVPAFLLVRASVEDLPVAVRALDPPRFLQGRRRTA